MGLHKYLENCFCAADVAQEDKETGSSKIKNPIVSKSKNQGKVVKWARKYEM